MKQNLNEDSLHEAVELIAKILWEAINDDNFHFTLPPGGEVSDVFKSWDLLVTFGDLDDNDGNFSEFVHHYNISQE